MSAAALLEVRNFCVDVADRAVLSEISFAIAPGTIVGLCGDSGCGKTTLALGLLQLLPSPPYRVRGEAVMGGRNLLALTERELESVRGARIGIVFQDALLALNPVLRVRTQLSEILRAHGVSRPLDQLLNLAGLPDPDAHSAEVPAPVERRGAAAGDYRSGAGLRTEAGDRGRTVHRAGRASRGRVGRSVPAAAGRNGSVVSGDQPLGGRSGWNGG